MTSRPSVFYWIIKISNTSAKVWTPCPPSPYIGIPSSSSHSQRKIPRRSRGGQNLIHLRLSRIQNRTQSSSLGGDEKASIRPVLVDCDHAEDECPMDSGRSNGKDTVRDWSLIWIITIGPTGGSDTGHMSLTLRDFVQTKIEEFKRQSCQKGV